MQAFGLAVIGRDVEVRFLDGGDAVINVSLAFSYGKKGGDGKRQSQWVDAAMYGKRAEALAPYLTKGTKVAVTLEDVAIQTYKTREGADGHKMVGKIGQLDLASAPKSQDVAPALRSPPPPPPKPAARPAPTGFADMDDDIPF